MRTVFGKTIYNPETGQWKRYSRDGGYSIAQGNPTITGLDGLKRALAFIGSAPYEVRMILDHFELGGHANG